MNGFDGDDVRNNDYWDDTTSIVSTADSNTCYMAKVEGIAEQTSLDITKSRFTCMPYMAVVSIPRKKIKDGAL